MKLAASAPMATIPMMPEISIVSMNGMIGVGPAPMELSQRSRGAGCWVLGVGCWVLGVGKRNLVISILNQDLRGIIFLELNPINQVLLVSIHASHEILKLVNGLHWMKGIGT